MTIIGAAKTSWFQGSGDGVSSAAATAATRMAYLTCRHRNRAETMPSLASTNTSVGIWKTATMPMSVFL